MKRIAIIAAMPGELEAAGQVVGGMSRRVAPANAPSIFGIAGSATPIGFAGVSGWPVSKQRLVPSPAAEKDGPLACATMGRLAGSALCQSLSPHSCAYLASGVIDMLTGERFPATDAPNGPLLVTSPQVAGADEKIDSLLPTALASGRWWIWKQQPLRASLPCATSLSRCIKGVSDGFTEDPPDFNPFISPDGDFQNWPVAVCVLFRPWYWPALIRMGENSNKASQAIRDLTCSKI